MKKRILMLWVMMVFGQFLTEAAISVNYTGNVVDAAGIGVPDGNQVRIGYFDSIGGFDVVTAAQNGDWSGTLTHWHQFSVTTTAMGISPPRPLGSFAASPSEDGTDFSGKQIDLWAFKTTANQPPTSWSDVVEYGVFLNPPSWTFPIEGSLTPFISIDSGDPGVQAYHGTVTLDGSLQLAAIPEPGAYVAATGVGLLLFSIYRKLIALRHPRTPPDVRFPASRG